MHDGATQQAQAQPVTVALFVSDVHLQPSMPHTVQAFLRFLQVHAPQASELFLLGDLFEYWAGDDDLDEALHRVVVSALATLAQSGTRISWIAGNRDFLVGADFARAAGLRLLQEPCVVELAGQRIVLVHGDAQCTDDRDYQTFRTQVRDPDWQARFLAQPLSQRKALIAAMRSGSRAAQREKSCEIMDVNQAAIEQLFLEADAAVMVHGHTHRPGVHTHEVAGTVRVRHVLPDWDCEAEHQRGGWLALRADGSFQRYRADAAPE